MTTDAEFLDWMVKRLVNVYHESANYDFVQALQRIADRLRVLDGR